MCSTRTSTLAIMCYTRGTGALAIICYTRRTGTLAIMCFTRGAGMLTIMCETGTFAIMCSTRTGTLAIMCYVYTYKRLVHLPLCVTQEGVCMRDCWHPGQHVLLKRVTGMFASMCYSACLPLCITQLACLLLGVV